MTKKIVAIVQAVLLSMFVQGCWAEQKPVEIKEQSHAQAVNKESDKAELIRKILSEHKLEVWQGNLTANQYKFCVSFYEDLKVASPKIQYVEPVLKTDDTDHPDLKGYLNGCMDRSDLPNDPDTFWSIRQIGDHGFRLYREEFDGISKNGLEEMLYSDVNFSKKKLNQLGGYFFIDLESCQIIGGKPTHGYENIGAGGVSIPVNNINALIRYHEDYYGLEVYDSSKHSATKETMYKVDAWKVKHDLKFEFACSIMDRRGE